MKKNNFIDRLWEIINEKFDKKPSHLAIFLGIKPGQVGSWIKRKSYPGGKHLKNIAEKLNVNINWLLTGKGHKYIEDTTKIATLYQSAPANVKVGVMALLRATQPVDIIDIEIEHPGTEKEIRMEIAKLESMTDISGDILRDRDIELEKRYRKLADLMMRKTS